MDNKIKTNAIFNLINQLMTLIIPLITMPYVSRVLGVENIGIQSYLLSIVSYFTLFAAFGLNDYGQREIAKNRDDKNKLSKLFLEMIANRFITSIIVISVYVILVFFVFEVNYQIYYLILMLNIFAIMFDVTWFFQGLEKFKGIAIRNTLVKVISAVLIFVLVKDSDDLVIYILISSISLILSALVMWPGVLKYISRTKITFKGILYHYRGALVYFIPAIAIQIYTVLDKSMIQWITNSNQQNGIYEQAEKIAKVGLTLIQFLNLIMCSRMSYLLAENKIEEAHNITMKSLKVLSLVMYPVALGIFLISPEFIPLYLGTGYEDSIILLQIFAFLNIFLGISGFIGSHYMNPSGQQWKSNIVLITGAIINFILNLILIPRFSAMGATISSVVAEGLIALLYVFNARKFIRPLSYIKIGYKNIIAAIIMCIVVYFSTFNIGISYIYMIMIKVALGIFVYGICCLIFRDELLLTTLKKVLDIIKQDR